MIVALTDCCKFLHMRSVLQEWKPYEPSGWTNDSWGSSREYHNVGGGSVPIPKCIVSKMTFIRNVRARLSSITEEDDPVLPESDVRTFTVNACTMQQDMRGKSSTSKKDPFLSA